MLGSGTRYRIMFQGTKNQVKAKPWRVYEINDNMSLQGKMMMKNIKLHTHCSEWTLKMR